jgi:hypothetical protein
MKTMIIKTTTVTTTTEIIVIPNDISDLFIPTEASKQFPTFRAKDDHDEALSPLVVPAS